MTPADEIKSKLDIIEVIRDYVPGLKAVGTNFTALSPFKREKNPSFVVSPDKQIWHCFSTGKGGDIFTFVMEMEGLSFPEAIRLLAPKAGVVLKRQNIQETSKRNILLDIMQSAVDYYHSNLLNSPQAGLAREYLEKRGLNQETISKWSLGFSKDEWEDLANYLRSKGYKNEDIYLAGLLVKKEGVERYYDRFRRRLMFPLNDVNGNPVGFTGRVLPGQSEEIAKYVNSPQTLLYDKSKILFGLDKAKQNIKQQEYVIIMEGQMDVITAHQFGFANSVAASGTALSQEQIKLLDRYTNNIIFALDADSAGQRATDRGEETIRQADLSIVESQDNFGKARKYIDPSQSYKKNLKVVVLPAGQDPDSFIRENPDNWANALRGAKPMMQYYFDRTFAKLNLSLLEHRRRAVKILLPLIGRLTDVVEKDFWLKKLSGLVEVEVKFLREAMSEEGKKERQPQVQNNTVGKSAPVLGRTEILSEAVLALVLKFPAYIKHILDYMSPEQLVGEGLRLIYKNLIIYYNEKNGGREEYSDGFLLNYADFIEWSKQNTDFNEEQKRLLDKLFIIAEKDYYDYDAEKANAEIMDIVKVLKKNYLDRRLRAISRLISEMEKSKEQDDGHELSGLLKEFNNLAEELRQFI